MQQDLLDIPLGSHLSSPWELGSPIYAGALTVFPVLGGLAGLDLVSLSEALEAGAFLKEMPDGPSVNDLIVHNPTNTAVLLVDGEEVIGAQQNRVFDGSVIVPAHTEIRVAVCCVEQGRWDGARRHEKFHASAQVAPPQVRRVMATARRASRVGRADQGQVWQTVTETLVATRTGSATSSLADAYTANERALREITRKLLPCEGQLGSMVFVGGHFVALDFIAHPGAYARMHGRLMRGYALQALEAEQTDLTEPTRAADILGTVASAVTTVAKTEERGARLTIGRDGESLHGTGLLEDDQLVHCSIFADAA